MANPDVELTQSPPVYPNAEQSGFGRYDRKQQQSLLNISGDGVLRGSIEVEDVDYSGTRSNVFTPSANEIITVSLIDGFNSGATQVDTQLDFDTESNSVTHSDTYSWPTGDISGGLLPAGWSYTEGGGSSGSQATAEGTVTNNTGSAVALNNTSFSITIDVTALPVSGSTQPGVFVAQDNGSILLGFFNTITSIGSYTASDFTSSSEIVLQDGESLTLYMFASQSDDQGFSYTVTDLQINTGASTATQYNLDVDLSDAVFIGDVSGTLTNNIDATSGITEIATATTTMFPTITSGSVYNSLTPDTGTGFTFSGRDQVGEIGVLSWDLRATATENSATVAYTLWNDWNNNFFAFGSVIGTLTDFVSTVLEESIFSNMTLSLTDRADSSITATFGIDLISSIDTDSFNDIYFTITSIISQTGVPAQNTNWDLMLTADVNSKSIDLDTNQIIDVSQMITITPNSGFKAVGEVIASDGIAASGQASTYTVTDPYGTELTSFTSLVSSNTESDVAEVVSMIVGAINNNTETPIDFTASSTGATITITAASGGEIPSVWIISVNNHGQSTDAGDIVFNTAARTTVGTDAAVSVIGGGLTSALQVSAPSLTITQIVDGLNSAVISGARVYNEPDADFALVSNDFMEYPELLVTTTGNTNSPFTFTESVKYWGASSDNGPYPDINLVPFGRYDRKQQQSLLSIVGDGSIDGSIEIQDVAYVGSRSNTFTPSNNEIVTINIFDEFNAGVTQTDTQLDLDVESNSVVHEAGDTYSWPTGDLVNGSLPVGWTYVEGNGSSNSQAGVEGTITNNTGGPVSLVNGTMSLTLNISSLPPAGSTRPAVLINLNSTVTNLFVISFPTITATGSYTVNANSDFNRIEDGDSLSLFIFESTASNQDFEYTVTDLQINTGVSSASTYNLDIDVGNTVFNGDVGGTFSTDVNASSAVAEVSSAVTSQFPSIVAGNIYDSLILSSGTSLTLSGRDTTGTISPLRWDLRDASGGSSSSVNFTTWNDWIGNFFGWGEIQGSLRTLTDIVINEAVFSNMILALTDRSSSSNNATFVLDTISRNNSDIDRYYSIQSIISQAGSPPQNGNFNISLTADAGSKAINLDTNQITNISQMLTITPNTGTDVMGEVSASDGSSGSGQASTYTVIDPYGTEVTSFTSSVVSETDTDVSTVISTIVQSINNNTETPIDFTATSNATNITITASESGEIPGLWLLSRNHHNQTDGIGDINLSQAVISAQGGNAALSLSGGGLESSIDIAGASLTKDIILQGLNSAVISGVSEYLDTDSDFALISDEFAEQPELDGTVTGNVNGSIEITTTTKYWGHT